MFRRLQRAASGINSSRENRDAYLTEQRTLVNQRSRTLVPVLMQRQSSADHLAKLLDRLGIDRVRRDLTPHDALTASAEEPS